MAQSNNNVDEVVKIERHAARDYREGEMIVKFKATSPVRVKAIGKKLSSGVSQVDRVFDELGVTAGEQLMPLTGAHTANRTKALKSVTGQIIPDADMTLLYRLQFDPKQVDVYQAIEKVKTLPEVEYAEPNYVVYALSADEGSELYDTTDEVASYTSEPLFPQQWGTVAMGLPQLWAYPKITNKRPVIAILDTGVDITHPDLKDNIWTNTLELEGSEGEDDDNNGFADDLYGYDFVNNTGRLGDWNGHGTHCAGIAAAVGNNGIGVAGANPDALIMPITVMQSDGTGDVATIIKGIDYAAANGADVISMSIGGYGYSLAEEQALAKAYSKAVLVAAAGNDNKCIYAHYCPVNRKNAMQNGPMYPAAFTFVLGVEASTQDGGLAPFSNFDEDGPVFSLYNEEQLYNYELRAPGAQIMSTFPGGKYKALNGTSMACPMVAGGISRLLQMKEYGNWEMLFGDLIHSRKTHAHQLVDFETVYNITDADRKPSLGLVTYTLDDAEGGDGDGKPDAGETLKFYPTLRNEWGMAENIRFTLETAENEDPTIVEILDGEVEFGSTLSSYGKNVSANPVRIKVRDNCTDGRKIRLVLRATCDNITGVLEQKVVLTAENGVEIGGLINEELTLYPGVNYIVTKNWTIAEGKKLTIKPGTVLKFKDNTSTYFPEGTLHCVGTPDSMIVFTSANLSTNLNNLRIDIKDSVEYVKFYNLTLRDKWGLPASKVKNCIIDGYNTTYCLDNESIVQCNITNSGSEASRLSWLSNYLILSSNVIGNIVKVHSHPSSNDYSTDTRAVDITNVSNCNLFGNRIKATYNQDVIPADGWLYSVTYNSSIGKKYTPEYPSYLGSAREDIVSNWIYDMDHPVRPYGFGQLDLSNMLTRPSAEAHGIVWKVVVNGYDAQDEFEILPPLGVGKHKFEVYFNRPMDVSVPPTIAMGVRPPYTSHTISEEGSWSADSLVYTAYLNIDGKTGADGLNRIYVYGARDNEYFEIPDEKYRFNVQVAAAGSMATGLMAEAGLGKVSLTWETDEEDFEDLLGYNIYRYTLDTLGVSSDSTIINSSVLESDATEYVDYDVVSGTTYYYVIKQLTTSLTSHALSNAVAATPLTAQKGDANGSMNVDIADVVTEVAYITYQQPQPFIFEAADVNSDEKVNVLDVVGTIGIITTPAQSSVNAIDDTPVNYYVQDGILYMENTQPLGGVQVLLNADKGTAIKALDGVKGMEQNGTWMSDSEYLFLAYSMSGRTIAPGTHALLEIGKTSSVTEVILSDAKGQNILAIDGNTTGIGKVEAMQMQMPTPNPFTTMLKVPYVIGQDGSHKVSLVFTDMTGRTLDAYHTVADKGVYTYTWYPKGLNQGLYLVSMYVDGKLMQTAKVICAGK